MENKFLFYALTTDGYHKEIVAGASGTTVKHTSPGKILNYDLLFPERMEQKKIGNFFSTLDDTITLKKTATRKNCQQQKAMLEKMFPRNGADSPEIRFEGFTEPWKQTPLGDIAEFNPKSLLPNTFRYVDLESVVGTSLRTYQIENKETAPSRAQRLARRGDIFFQTVRPYQKNNLLYDLPFDDFVFSTGYAQLRPSIDSYFLFSRLREDRFVAEVLDYCTGTSYPAITPTNLAIIKISISTEPQEQTAIGNFFRNLDTLSEAQQQELEKLQNIKKPASTKCSYRRVPYV